MKKNLMNLLWIGLAMSLTFCTSAPQQEDDSDTAAVEETAEASDDDGFVALFNGEDLNRWEVKGGDANFYVEDGMIVGLTEEDLPNCFLTTTDTYSDFVLEADFKIEPNINSGIQIRSKQYEEDTTTPYLSGKLEEGTRDWEAGRVYGYQIEIDPSDRAWTGGFYEEGGRGWLQPLTENEAAREAFKPGEWNHFRIEAKGNSIKTWVNGVPAADATDDHLSEGFIGLQLHGAWKEDQIGQKVYYKNIQIKELGTM